MQISAFWQNDRPGGVGVTMREHCDEIWEVIENSYRQMWVEAVEQDQEHELVTDMFSQLAAIGAKAQPSFRDAILAAGNIWLLEQNGYIQPDEFNGMQFANAVKKSRR